MDKVLGYAEAHISNQNFEGAVVVLHAAMKQLVATLAGEDMNNQSDPDITIYTQRECMVSIDDIKEICAKTLGVSVAEIESRKRTQDVALARQCAIFYSRKQGYGVEELGKVFDRNHSNISHTVNKIHDLLECDPEMASKINLVGRNINGQN
tara:strand:+ start:1309 stop:1764 length:456 start_codon:yes stop_codon:yes gene_type:complete